MGEHKRWSEQVRHSQSLNSISITPFMYFFRRKTHHQTNPISFNLTGDKPPPQCEELKKSLHELPLQAQLAAAFITYLGAKPEDTRAEMMHHWAIEVSLINPQSCAPSPINTLRYIAKKEIGLLEAQDESYNISIVNRINT